MFETIDNWVLHQCTKFSHWLQRNTGLTNFFVVKVGFFLMGLSIFIDLTNYWFPLYGDSRTSLLNLFVFILLLFIQVQRVNTANKNEERLWQGRTLLKDEFNASWGLVFWRMVFLFSFVFSTFVFFLFYHRLGFFEILSKQGWFTGLVVTEYFLLVTPLPPGMSKLRKMIEGFANSLRRPVPTSNFSTPRQKF